MNRTKMDVLSIVVNREIHSSPTGLPAHFPDVAQPAFKEGELLRWITGSEQTDWGIVIGRFYNYAPHRRCWMWCYLIWLDKQSPSAAWIVADTAWQDDLEPLDSKEA
ncbi:MAG TPA: hypothetical protein V6D14_27865 [Coleofasciculaceae cyanobacterium]|jgi:hypothetical protein